MLPAPLHPLYKSKFCEFVWRSHGCRYGDKCWHAHSWQDYRGPPVDMCEGKPRGRPEVVTGRSNRSNTPPDDRESIMSSSSGFSTSHWNDYISADDVGSSSSADGRWKTDAADHNDWWSQSAWASWDSDADGWCSESAWASWKSTADHGDSWRYTKAVRIFQ